MTPSKTAAAAALAAGILAAPATRAQVSGDAIRIGFITDLSGPYAELDGPAGGEYDLVRTFEGDTAWTPRIESNSR